jgi:hypothetical protein
MMKPMLLALALSLAIANPASAQTDAHPANSHASAYGDCWACDYGYESTGAACLAIALPANARLRARGDGWECVRGFRSDGQACRAIILPEHDIPRGVFRR